MRSFAAATPSLPLVETTKLPNVDQLLAGMATRRRIAKAIAGGAPKAVPFEGKKLSLARDYFLSQYTDQVDSTSSSFIDLQIVAMILRGSTVAEGVTAHDALLGHANSRYLGALTLGFSSGANVPQMSAIASDLDRSLYFQSLALKHPHDGLEHLKLVREHIADCFGYFGVRYPLQSFADLKRLSKRLNIRWSPGTLSELHDLATQLVRKTWYLWGPELRLALHQLGTDAGKDNLGLVSNYGFENLTRNAEGLHLAASQLLAGDAAVPSEPSEFTEDRFATQVRSRSPRSSWCNLDSGYFEYATTLFHSLRNSILNNALERAYSTLALIYELDPLLLQLVDWEKMHSALPTFREVPSVPKCFVDILFARFGVSSPGLRIARGDGIFIGSYFRIIDAARQAQKSLHNVVAQIKLSLPPRAAATFAQFILRADTLVDLYLRLPASPQDAIDDEEGKTDYLRATQRMALVQQFVRQRILTKQSCADIVEEERKCIAVLRFRKALARGRIRIPSDAIRGEAERFVENVAPGLDFNRRYADIDNARYADSFRSLLQIDIDDLIERTFLSGPHSLDKILSSNIRHGWVTDRYQASFPSAVRDAYSDADAQNAFNWEDDVVVQSLGAAYEAVTDLKKEIALDVETFKENFLVVTDAAPQVRALYRKLEELTLAVLAAEVVSQPAIVHKVREELGHSIRRLLDDMRTAFETKLAPKIVKLIERCRSQVSAAHGARYGIFFEALLASIKTTHREIAEWLRATEDDVEFRTFAVSHLAVLEADIVHLSGSQGLNYSTRCVEHQPGIRRVKDSHRVKDFQIKGVHFPLMTEVVHNLMSNAIKHSGEANRTKIYLDFIDEGSDFLVICRNSASRTAIEQLTAKYDKVIKLTSAQSGQLVQREGNSGFQKIIDACCRSLYVTPHITVHRPRLSGGEVVVEVRLPAASEKLRAH